MAQYLDCHTCYIFVNTCETQAASGRYGSVAGFALHPVNALRLPRRRRRAGFFYTTGRMYYVTGKQKA